MALTFASTRSGEADVAFQEAMLRGMARDGGLFVPESIPACGTAWRQPSDFQSVASSVLGSWLGAGERTIDAVVQSALDFPVPVVRLAGGEWDNVLVVELFHGPTLSFKDFGARCMAELMALVPTAGVERTVLVATSGDTGSAVADGFSGHEGIRVVLLYPRSQVSPTQERQLTAKRPGVRTYAVDGTFDDCQRMVKEAFRRPEHVGHLTSANSINVGRLLPQMTYYFWAAREFGAGELLCCVPSGNLGNLTAGVLSHLSGSGIGRFIAAHNANDFVPRFLETGDVGYRPSIRTLSNAMDVGVPSNFERLRHILSDAEMRSLIWATSVSDEVTTDTMRNVFESTGYVADPHTAVAFEAVTRYRKTSNDHRPVAIMATAHPGKFPETVKAALGFDPDVPARLAEIWHRDSRSAVIGAGVEHLVAIL